MIKLVWCTDLHLVARGRPPLQNLDASIHLRTMVDEVASQHCDAARLILGGDLTQSGEPDAYQLLHDVLAEVPVPTRLLAGNHDQRSALLETFPQYGDASGFVQGVEDLGAARILYLDTVANDGGHHGELCPARLDWLEVRLAEADERPLLLFLHHPPCDLGVPALDRLRLLDCAGLEARLRMRRAPTHLFCGHVHRNAAGRWAGHGFATLKSLHRQIALDMTGTKLAYSDEPPGFAVILVEGDDIVVHYRDLPAC